MDSYMSPGLSLEEQQIRHDPTSEREVCHPLEPDAVLS